MSPSNAIRIAGGTARGRRLLVPAAGTRPTSSKARQALFNRLDTLLDVTGCHLLDLYAGSGAVGLEALSRGGAAVRFVESDRRAAALVTANARALGVAAERYSVEVRPVSRVLAGPPPPRPFDVVFADPPYALEPAETDSMLAAATTPDWLVEGGIAVIERSARGVAPTWPVWVEALPEKRYGEGVLWYGRARSALTGVARD